MIKMYTWKVKIFLSAWIFYGKLGYLNLDKQELNCFYKECLIMARYLEDSLTITVVNVLLGELYEEMHRLIDALTFYEEAQTIAAKGGHKAIQGHALTSMGKLYFSLGRYQEAIEYHNKDLNIAIEIGDKEGEGKAHMYLVNAYLSLSKHHEAIEHAEKVLRIAKEMGDKKEGGTTNMIIGSAYMSLSKCHEAIRYYEKSLNIAIDIGDKKLEGSTYTHLGDAYLALSKYHEAIECYEKRLHIIDRGKVDKEVQGITYINLGNACLSLSKYNEAFEYYEKGLRIAKEIGDKSLEGAIYTNLGNAYLSISKYKEGTGYYEQGLRIAKEMGDKSLEGTTYTNLGNAYSSLSKYHEAIKCYENGLRIAIKIGNKMVEGTTYTNLGDVYSSLGKYHEAIEYCKKGLSIAIEIGDKKREGTSYLYLGNSYQKCKKYHEAIDYYEKSLSIVIELGDKMGEGNTYTGLGNVNWSLDKYYETIKYGEKGLTIAIEIDNKEIQVNSYLILGNAYQRFNKYNEAIYYYEKSLNMAIEIGDKQIEAVANSNIGALHHSLSVINEDSDSHDDEFCRKTMHQSIHFLKEAIRCWDWLFDHLKEQHNFKISIVDTFIDTYKLLSTVLIETQQIEEALLVCDRGRARALGDILVSKYGITQENAFRSVQLECTDIQTVYGCVIFFAFLYNRGLGIWVSTHQKPLIFIDCEDEGFNHATQLLQLKDGQKRNMNLCFTKVVNDAYKKMKVGQVEVRCENRSLDSPDDSQQIKYDNLDTTEKSSLSAVKRNITPVDEHQSRSEQDPDPLQILFNVLLAPVLENNDQEDIVIIPEGPLYTIPFAALQYPNTGLYLSETKRIRLAPSLNTLTILQECLADCHCKIGALIVGDPAVGEVMFRGEQIIFNRLPSAEHEAKIIGGILNDKPLTGSEATKEMVKKKLQKGVAIIHIAAHGSAEGGQIALAPPTQTEAKRIPEEQDYMLTMREVQEIGVRAQLVVLSCCHSGRGEIKSEGVVGMSRAFLAAGARAVVASLWAIDDKATLNFMLSFYMHLKMGESASKSLQQAMKEMREEGYDEPRHWAPFFLIGDDVTICF